MFSQTETELHVAWTLGRCRHLQGLWVEGIFSRAQIGGFGSYGQRTYLDVEVGERVSTLHLYRSRDLPSLKRTVYTQHCKPHRGNGIKRQLVCTEKDNTFTEMKYIKYTNTQNMEVRD